MALLWIAIIVAAGYVAFHLAAGASKLFALAAAAAAILIVANRTRIRR